MENVKTLNILALAAAVILWSECTISSDETAVVSQYADVKFDNVPAAEVALRTPRPVEKLETKQVNLESAEPAVVTEVLDNPAVEGIKAIDDQQFNYIQQEKVGIVEQDARFAATVAEGVLREVQLAELAMRKASSREITNFATNIKNNHVRMDRELKSIASQKDIVLPVKLSAKHMETYKRLSAMNGSAFDKAYCSMMVESHQADVNRFKAEAEWGTDGSLRSWAASKLSMLERQLLTAQSMEATLGIKRL